MMLKNSFYSDAARVLRQKKTELQFRMAYTDIITK